MFRTAKIASLARRALLGFVLSMALVACQNAADSAPPPSTTVVINSASTPAAPVQNESDQPTAADTPAVDESSPLAQPADFDWVFDETAEPINLSLSLAEDQAAEALIPVTGGSLTVTGPDGTRFTLDIPTDALLAETHIRMIPAVYVSGMPSGLEQTVLVQLEPEGLFFNDYATLTIVPTAAVPIDEQIMFGYHNHGEGMYLAPLVVDSEAVQLQILHFSGYGLSKGLLADLEPVRRRLGGSVEDRITSQVSSLLSQERQRKQLGMGEGQFPDLGPLMQEYMEKVVKPRIAAAGESCASGHLAMQTLLSLERQRQLLGVGGESGDSLMDQVIELMPDVGKICLQEEYELCRDEHIVHRILPAYLGIERQKQLLGIEDDSGGLIEGDGWNLVDNCLQFELEFESTGDFDYEGDGFTSQVRAKVPVRLAADSAEFKMTGSAPLDNYFFEFRLEDCNVTSNRGGATFEVFNLGLEVAYRGDEDQVGYVEDVKLVYYPGATTESFVINCEDQAPFSFPASSMWTGLYSITHADEISNEGGSAAGSPPSGGSLPGMGGMTGSMFMPVMPVVPEAHGFVATGWEMAGGELFATLEWQTQDGGLGLTENGVFNLYHRPVG